MGKLGLSSLTSSKFTEGTHQAHRNIFWFLILFQTLLFQYLKWCWQRKSLIEVPSQRKHHSPQPSSQIAKHLCRQEHVSVVKKNTQFNCSIIYDLWNQRIVSNHDISGGNRRVSRKMLLSGMLAIRYLPECFANPKTSGRKNGVNQTILNYRENLLKAPILGSSFFWDSFLPVKDAVLFYLATRGSDSTIRVPFPFLGNKRIFIISYNTVLNTSHQKEW